MTSSAHGLLTRASFSRMGAANLVGGNKNRVIVKDAVLDVRLAFISSALVIVIASSSLFRRLCPQPLSYSDRGKIGRLGVNHHGNSGYIQACTFN